MKGSYVLLIELKKKKKIKIGALGKLKFRKGFYTYIGSAMNNLEKRVARHLRKNKKLHWHIDYFLQKAEIEEVYLRESNKREECKIAREFSLKFPSVKNFGCSDCKCESHLFYAENLEEVRNAVGVSRHFLY